MIAIKNPDTGAPVSLMVNVGEGPKKYTHPVGKTLVYSDKVAEVLLEHYPFLEKDEPTISSENYWKCKYCDYRNLVKVAIYGHLRHHHKDKEQVAPEQTGSTVPTADVNEGAETLSRVDQIQKAKREMWQETKAMQAGHTDRDGVEWTGGGLEPDDGK